MPTSTNPPTRMPPRRRRLARTGVALVVVGAGLVLGAQPAPANTVALAITAGEVDLFENGGVPAGTVDLVTNVCDPAVTGVITRDAGATAEINAVLGADVAVTIGGDHYRATYEMELSGGDDGMGGVALNGSSTLKLEETTGPASCTVTSAPCEIESINLVLTGTTTAADVANLTIGDEVSVSGGNTAFETFGVCGSVNADLGHVEHPVLDLEVVSVPPGDAAAVTGGTLELERSGGSTFDTIVFGGGLGQCSPPSTTVTVGGTSAQGVVSVAMRTDQPYRSPGGTDFRVVTEVSWIGRHEGGVVTLTGTGQAYLTPTTGFGSCSTTGTACTVGSAYYALTGSFDVTDPTQFGTGDTLTVTGDTGWVSTTGGTCSDMTSIDGGTLELTALALTGT